MAPPTYKAPFSGAAFNIQMAVTAVHMISMAALVPGMWTYLKALGASVNYIGWGMAAFPFGAWASSWYLRDAPLGPISMITRPRLDENDKPGTKPTNGTVKRKPPKGKPWSRSMFALLLLCGIVGNCIYALGQTPEVVLGGRVIAGVGAAAIVLTHKYVEFSTGGDEVMLRSRMVLLGTIQAVGAVLGVTLAVLVATLPSIELADHEFSHQPLVALIVALFYTILLPMVWATYDQVAPRNDVINHIDQAKGEIDAPPSNYLGGQRLGLIVPAIVYDRGQAQPSGMPDVFSTAVVLVEYFMMNNMIIGVEVAHGPLCDDLYGWGSLDTSVTYTSFVVAGVIGIMLSLSLSDEVPCNRRLFGSFVVMFVTYGLMLQPHTPKEQYIAFLVLLGASFTVADLAITEIHVDKIGKEDDDRMTASIKHMVLGWLNSTACFTRVFSAIITGYIYSYYSEMALDRRPYAVYGCGFGVALLMVMMTIIFYKRFQLRILENQVVPPDKMPLQPQVINCVDDA